MLKFNRFHDTKLLKRCFNVIRQIFKSHKTYVKIIKHYIAQKV